MAAIIPSKMGPIKKTFQQCVLLIPLEQQSSTRSLYVDVEIDSTRCAYAWLEMLNNVVAIYCQHSEGERQNGALASAKKLYHGVQYRTGTGTGTVQ